MKLIVLAGAKEGTVIPLKKKEFTIGRSKECTLRAGSEAISRQHCILVRTETGFSARDLGSRNGTFVNGQKIEQETELHDGDELCVGPLRFRVSDDQPAAQPTEAAEQAAAPAKPAAPKTAAEAASRVAKSPGDSDIEDDISRWLLGVDSSEQSLKETRTLAMGDTRAVGTPTKATAAILPDDAEGEPAEETAADDNADEEKGAGDSKKGWNLFGRGKGKKEPGKLPTRPDDKKTKDSRDAAAEILREMTRRR